MIQSLTSAIGALQVQSERLNIHAHNIANLNTPGFQAQIPAQQTAIAGGVQLSAVTTSKTPGTPIDSEKPTETNNVDLIAETVGTITALRAFEASAKVIKTSDEMLKIITKI